ncbi:zinc finger protein 236 isoform X1 [Dendroctonus ponderosae]|uniref:zinc finger protein 236 isoform X1 n=1 Tax=Dendroctonus ponderosae TaxID=77166 RepID=UPI002034BD45|nr:zinc finger protein 236 isoform X1 [Dendroctonus ponderosae]KAH1006186.1 hypothetical protein HUJ05_006947 [Dendroctonus ponderosae]
MDSVLAISENCLSSDLLQMDLLFESLKMSSSQAAPKYTIQQLDETHFELITCETDRTYSLHLTEQQAEIVDFEHSNKVPVISSVQKDSVIQYSARSVLKSANSNQDAPKTHRPPVDSDDAVYYACCAIQFDGLPAFREHLKLHVAEEKFGCPQCHARFLTENNMKIHMVTKHPGNSNVCPICQKSFHRKASLKAHVQIHQEEEMYPCARCCEELPSYDALLKHMERHAVIKKPIDPLMCRYCKIQLETPAQYQKHLATHKDKRKNGHKNRKTKKKRTGNHRKKLICRFCTKVFPKFYLLERHERVHTGEKPFKCHICHKGFAQSNSLKLHLDKHKGLKPHSCPLCPAKFTQKGNLTAHINKTHNSPHENNENYRCPQCSCMFKRVSSLNGHITKAHVDTGNETPKEQTDPQSVIDKVVSGLKELNNDPNRSVSKQDKAKMPEVDLAENQGDNGIRRYAIRHEKIGDVRWYFCNYCSSRFKKPSDLIRHFRTHTLEKPFKCPKCEQTFSLKTTLTHHFKIQHSPLEVECSTTESCQAPAADQEVVRTDYLCLVCERRFPTIEESKAHGLEHENEFQTSDNSFESISGNLALPSARSAPSAVANETAQENALLCKICGFKCSGINSLASHVMQHNDDKNSNNTARPQESERKTQGNIHVKISKFKCSTCGKIFKSLALLTTHCAIHRRAKPTHKCPCCGKAFKTAGRYRAHMKKSHPQKELSFVKQPDKLANGAQSTADSAASNGTLLSVVSEEQGSNAPTQLPADYNMMCFNISGNEILSQSSLIPNINLYNSLDSLQDSATVFFNIDPGKPDMVDPNEVLKYNKLDKPQLSETASEPAQSDTLLESDAQDLYTVNLSDIPISIISSSEELDSDIISNSPVLCINCHKLFSSCALFENHICSEERTAAEQNNLELIIQDGTTHTVKSQIFSETGSVNNVPVIQSPAVVKKMPEIIFECPTFSMPTPDQIVGNLPGGTIKSQLQHYVDDVEEAPQIYCKHCKSAMQSEEQYRKHLFLHPDLADKICKYCCRDFKKPSDLKRHLRTHTGEKPFECDTCHKKFSLKATLQGHIRTHNIAEVPKITCNVCNTNFTTKSSLKLHMLKHTGAKPYACQYCEQTFRTIGTRKTHQKNHLNNQKVAEDPAKLAGVKLIKYLAEQMESNDLSKGPQTVDKEPVVLVDSQQLNWVPMESTELFQQLQPYGFIISSEAESNVSRTADDLAALDVNSELQLSSTKLPDIQVEDQKTEKRSQKKQERKQRVECDVCHKLYSSKDVLRKHKKCLHGQNKKFPCIKCDKGYDQLDDLHKHISKLHSGHRPYTCDYCLNSFGEEGSLKTHIKRMHQKCPVPEETDSAILELEYDFSSQYP